MTATATAADAILVALSRLPATVRQEVLREMSPADRENYWAELADARQRLGL